MKVFVAGATGVVGRRAVAQMRAAGADVTGVARSRARGDGLRAIGATPVEVSLFDRGALSAAVAGHEVVVNLATSVPTGERASRPNAWEDNHRIRREGSRNLVDAALRAGAERYVQESLSLLYADGGDLFLDEAAAVDPTAITEPALTAEAEAARFAQQGGVGAALRFGTFYGFDSSHTVETIEAARQGLFVVPGPADAYWPSVTTDDAAAAVVAALRAPTGVYNVAEDRPLTRAEHATALAAALGTDPPPVPTSGGGLPPDVSMMGRSLRVSSQLFKALTGWQPRFPSAWEGWRFVVAAGGGLARGGRMICTGGSPQPELPMAHREPSADADPGDSPLAENLEHLAREFMEHRPRLLGIAYRMLGTMWDAEDIVADAMVRWLAVDREQVRDPAAFLTTMVTRRALDQLRSARVARESYTGEWLPEPIGTEPSPMDPLDTVERRESVSLATLRVMEQLTPPERAVFVLHEAFAVPHSTIADVLDISQNSSRQHLHRARAHLEGGSPRFDPGPAELDAMFERFLAALECGDLEALQDVLASDAVAYSDGGGKARAARRPVVGADRVVAFFGALRRHHAIRVVRRVAVNGRPGALLWFGRQYQLLTVDGGGGEVREVHSIMNPDKLRYLHDQLDASRSG